jgi:hypothetical protein
LVVSATINPNVPSVDLEDDRISGRSKMVIFELSMKNESATSPISLAKMFQWSYDGPVGGVEISYANEGKEASNTIYSPSEAQFCRCHGINLDIA